MAKNKSPWLLTSIFAVLFSAAAFANYDPRTGRFLTRDPIGTRPESTSIGSMLMDAPMGGSSEISELGIDLRDIPIELNPSDQYADGANLYAYVAQNPIMQTDLYGLWGENVHYYGTASLARRAGLCHHPSVGSWCNGVDSGFGNPPNAYAGSTIGQYLIGPLGKPIRNAYLQWIAYWHFPGADLGQPVSPGSPAAQREVRKGIVTCNLERFSKGLHQLQDSWSHQSNGQLPPFGDNFLGHSRDRYGWNTERWNDPVANPYMKYVVNGYGPAHIPTAAQIALLKKLRIIAVVLSSDADDISLFAPDARAALLSSYGYMKTFLRACPCIQTGEFKGQKSRCGDTQNINDLINDYLNVQFPLPNNPNNP